MRTTLYKIKKNANKDKAKKGNVKVKRIMCERKILASNVRMGIKRYINNSVERGD